MAFLLWMIRALASLLCGTLRAAKKTACRRALSGRMPGRRWKRLGVVFLGEGEMMVRLVLDRWGFGVAGDLVPAPVPHSGLHCRCFKAIPSGRMILPPAYLSRSPADFSFPAPPNRR
jgi:hypothetical protein